MLDHQPLNTRSFPIKTKVKSVLGIYIYIGSATGPTLVARLTPVPCPTDVGYRAPSAAFGGQF